MIKVRNGPQSTNTTMERSTSANGPMGATGSTPLYITIRRSLANTNMLTPAIVQHLQGAIGNRVVQRMLYPTHEQTPNASQPSQARSQAETNWHASNAAVQRKLDITSSTLSDISIKAKANKMTGQGNIFSEVKDRLDNYYMNYAYSGFSDQLVGLRMILATTNGWLEQHNKPQKGSQKHLRKRILARKTQEEIDVVEREVQTQPAQQEEYKEFYKRYQASSYLWLLNKYEQEYK